MQGEYKLEKQPGITKEDGGCKARGKGLDASPYRVICPALSPSYWAVAWIIQRENLKLRQFTEKQFCFGEWYCGIGVLCSCDVPSGIPRGMYSLCPQGMYFS